MGALGTYSTTRSYKGTKSGTEYTASAEFVIHVGPVVDMEVRAVWDAPGVFTLTAVNHGPDIPPAAEVTVTLPPGLRFARSEASQGSFDPARGVWNIGKLDTPEYRRALGLPEGPTLTIFTEPTTNTSGPGQMATASIENAQDYQVCIDSSGGDVDAASGSACTGTSGNTWHTAKYYDYIPGNNEVSLAAGWTAPAGDTTTHATGMSITSPAGRYLPGQDLEVEATFSDTVTASAGAKLLLQVGQSLREATAVPSTGESIRFRYRVQWADRTDPGKRIRVPANPFGEFGAVLIQPTGGRTLSLLFPGQDLSSGHAIGPQPDRVWDKDAGVFVNVPEWSDPVFLTTGQEGSRYRFMDGMRHYYVYDSLTRRWMLEFRIAGPRLSADDLDLIQWLYLRGSGYYSQNQGHPYGDDADPVEGRPYLGRWGDLAHRGNQACWGLEAVFSPGKTRGQRLEELADIGVDRFGRAAFARYEITQPGYVSGLLNSAKGIAPETCPAAPDGLRASPAPGASIVGMEMNSVGPYSAGDAIAVAVIFDREVDVTGAPQLAIEVGGEARTAVYDAALSGPRSKVFRYTARDADRDSDGVSVYPGSIILPTGASIRDPGGIPARLEHNGLGAQSGHTVGPVRTGSMMMMGAQGVAAPPAVVTGLAMRSSGPYAEGDAVSVAATFDWDVTVAGTPALNIEVGGTTRAALYQPALSEAAVKVFSYTVQPGDQDSDGVSVYPGSIALPSGASIRDEHGTDADLTLAAGLAPQPGHTVGVSGPAPPSVTGLEMRSAGPYAAGDAIEVVSHFSQPVAVAGTPSLRLQVGIRTRAALYTAEGGDNDSKVFRYTVQEEDRDEDGVSIAAGSIVLPEGAFIRNAGGIDAALAHAGLPAQAGHTVGAQQQQAPTVPADSPLVPDGLEPGDSFRLLFVTSATTTAESADIADYNAFVRTAAGNHDSLKPFKDGFNALISTSAVDARDNTGTTQTGVPVHWVGSDKVADDYADLYDGSWDSVSGKTEGGSSYTGLVWTGGNKAGGKSGQSYAGAAEVRMGDLSDATLPLSSPTARAATESYPLYALSQVITVAAQQQQQAANSEPQFALDSDARSVAENAAVGANVGAAIAATDADGDTLTYALTGSGAFAIDAGTGQITVRENLDYEAQSSYGLTVAVSDGKNASGGADSSADDTIAITVSVGNVDEAGTVSFNADPPQAGSLLTASLLDPDGGVNGETWTWEVSADGTNWSAIDGASGASYTPSGDDAGRYLRATAGYTDGQGQGKSAAAATASAVEAAPSAQQQQAPTLPADSPLVPTGLEPGDSFRLLFVTSTSMKAESADIADYNAFVRTAAGNHDNLKPFKDGFNALISTSAVDARDNTGTTQTGVPVHWLGGEKAADDYADLYDGSWDSVSGKTEGGSSYTGLVWTGGNKAGGKSGQSYAGAAEVRMGDLSDATLPLSSPTARAATESHPLYAISPVITVAAAAQQQPEPPANDAPAIVAGPVITSIPASGDTYGNGEAIVAAVVFSEAVTVSGEPRVRLGVGGRQRWARYDHSSEDGMILVFAYEVKGNDRDHDGVSIPENGLGLNRGSIEDADGNAADLSAPALADQSGHKVDGSQEAAQQQQQVANSEPQFGSDSDARSVAEDAATGSNVGNPVVATDADGDALTYALTGSGTFAIDPSTGQITVAGALDYETQSSYGLTVAVSDGKNASGGADSSADDTIAITVSVGNVDEAGTVTLDPVTPQAGSLVTARLNDPDGGVSGETWAWESSADGTNWAAVDGASGASYTPSGDDAGRYLRATASYADGQGPGKNAVATTASAVEPAPSAQRQQAPTLPADSPLVPTGLGPGDSFRLLFVTSTTTKAESSDVADYNKFVQTRAAANTNLASFSGQFTAYISTATVDARDNTGTTGTGVSVHWLGGEKAADDYADLYDGSWDSVSGKTEGGSGYTGLVWTGGNKAGGKSGQSYAGAAEVRMGDLSDATLPLSSPTARAATESYPLYALSPVITVAQPE